MHLVLDHDKAPTDVPRLLKRLADSVEAWPHFLPPTEAVGLTVCHVALAGTMEEHVERARAWAAAVWGAWSARHDEVAEFVARNL